MKANSKKVTIDGIVFDSGHEGDVYRDQLRPLARSGAITQLQCHPKFTFIVNGVIVGTMKPDFVFVDSKGLFGPAGMLLCWDAKGFRRSKKTGRMLPRVDREFGMKKRLLRALFALEIVCV